MSFTATTTNINTTTYTTTASIITNTEPNF